MAAAVPADGTATAPVHCGGAGPRITNVVATVDTRRKLNLLKVSEHCRNTVYDSQSTTQIVSMQGKQPKFTAKIFPSGKINITGATSEANAVQAAKLVARMVHRSQPEAGVRAVKAHGVRIHNIVASCNVAFPINLPWLHAAHPLVTKYEPQHFHGLHYNMRDLGVVLIIFNNGKVNMTGAKTTAILNTAFERIVPTLQQFCLRSSTLPVIAAAGSNSGAAAGGKRVGSSSSGGSSNIGDSSSKDGSSSSGAGGSGDGGGSRVVQVGQQEYRSGTGVAGMWQQQRGSTTGASATAARPQQQQCISSQAEVHGQQLWQHWQQQCCTANRRQVCSSGSTLCGPLSSRETVMLQAQLLSGWFL